MMIGLKICIPQLKKSLVIVLGKTCRIEERNQKELTGKSLIQMGLTICMEVIGQKKLKLFRKQSADAASY